MDARATGSELPRGVECGRVDAMDQLSRMMVTHTAFRLFQGDYGHPHRHTPPRIRGPQIDSRERLSFYLGHTETKLVRVRTTCHVSRMVTVEKQ